MEHWNRISEQSYGRKLTKKIGHSDTRLGANRKSVVDETTGQVFHKNVKLEHKKHDEIFQYFTKKETWNKICIKNGMSDYQVFDENKNDEEVEQ